jgi:hypothetical protein
MTSRSPRSQRALATLQRAVQSSSAEDAALLTFWRQTGQAMLAIVEAKLAGPNSVH